MFTYDKNGNITKVSNANGETTYVYDSAGQLLRENNQAAGKTWVWTYDSAGNILSKAEYAYTTGTLGTATDTVLYGYTDDKGWGDLLTSYDGQEIKYDEVGNPEKIGDWSFTWEHGRELRSMTDGTTRWGFLYDADGMRIIRNNGTIAYWYLYNGDMLRQMTVGDVSMSFVYNADGPMIVGYSGTTYYYVRNLQGDIIAILDPDGNAVVEYTYDAWGKILSVTGSMADTLGFYNPFRYRGYVYDAETGLYYLQSRYYDPEMGRFINADVVYDLDAGLQGYNLFAYCGNSPINRVDSSGADSEEFDGEADDTSQKEVMMYGGGGGNGNPSGGGGYPSGGSSYGNSGGGFRKGLQNLTGESGAGKDAHHIFPKHFSYQFNQIGINNQNPAYGSWWESSVHRKESYEYNQWWFYFFKQDGVTAADAFALVEFLSMLFGFDLNY